MAEGARFEVHLTKARGILGDDTKPFEVNLVTEGNALHWQVRELEDVELESLTTFKRRLQHPRLR